MQDFYEEVLPKNSKKNIAGVSFNEVEGQRPEACNFIEKETPTQEEVFRFLNNNFFIEQLWTTISGYIRILTAIKFQYQS